MNIEELHAKHGRHKSTNSAFYDWEIDVIDRIAKAIKDDEEATVLFKCIVSYCNTKSLCSY